MNKIRLISAVLLALPLIVFGSNYFLHLMPLPPGDGSPGAQLLEAMRTGGLMAPLAFSHVLVGVLLGVPRTRFVGALLQLPITLGIVAFHATLLPAGLGMGLVLLLLNLGALAEPSRWRALMATSPLP